MPHVTTRDTRAATTRETRTVTRTDLARILLGWGAFAALTLSGSLLEPPVPAPLLVGALVAIIAVILVCAFGVVQQAEALAHRLGDPYGSLVLTLSIVLIEVILISAVMLGPGDHATIARDSVMAVSMIILNLVIGAALLVGGLRHGGLRHNPNGTSTYLAMLVALTALAFALPALIGDGGAYLGGQALFVVVLTVALYGFFLARQLGAQAGDFQDSSGDAVRRAPREPSGDAVKAASRAQAAGEHPDTHPAQPGIRATLRIHRREVLTRLVLLVVTVLPIVLLSHDLATLLDDGLDRLGAPVALSGILIAMIVFLPESITTIRAALAGEGQRVSNLCHGALVSTVGLTIPAVLVIGALTGQTVVLAESPANLLLLGVTLLLSVATFAAKRVTATHGAIHLVVFAVYALVVMS